MRLPRMLVPIIALALAGGCHDRAADRVRVEKAWVRLPAAPGLPGAAYLTMLGGPARSRLIAVDTARAGASELHASMTMAAPGGGGMATMRRLDGIDIPARGEIKLAPGGYHAMLFGLAPGLRPGEAVPLVVRFARDASLHVEAKAVGAGDAPPY